MTAAENYPESLLTPDGEVYKTLFENSPLPMWIYDLETLRFMEVNGAAVRRYGYSRSEFLDMTINDLRPPEEHAPTETSTEAGPVIREWRGWRHSLKNGEVIEVEITTQGLRYKGHRAAFVIISNPTTRKQPQPLATEEGRFRKIFENATVAMILLDPESGRVVEANRSAASFYGYAHEAMVGLNFSEIVVGRKEGSFQNLTEFIAASTLKRMKSFHRFSDGKTRHVEAEGSEIPIGERKLICLTVSEAKAETEEEVPRLVAAENVQVPDDSLKSVLVDVSDLALILRKSDYKIVEANKVAESIFGLSHEGLLGRTIFDLSAGGNSDALTRRLDEVDGSGEVVENIFTRGDGLPFPAEMKTRLIRIGGEDELVVIVRDDNHEKQAETTLREYQEKYRTIFEKSPVGILNFDSRGVVTECNDRLASIMSSPRESIIGLKLLELPNKELAGAIRKVLEGKLSLHEGEYRSFAANKALHVRTTFAPIPSLGNLPSGGIAIFEDISERGRVESALRDSEKRYRLLYESSPVPYHLLDADWKIIDVNESWMDLLGYSRKEVVGRDFVEFVSQEHKNELKKRLDSFLSAGVLGSIEVEVIHKKGQRFTVAVEGRIVREPDGKISQSQFMLYDITERKMAEKALKESEEKFRNLAESASSAIFMYQNNKVCYVNPACVKITGYDSAELLRMNFWDIVHPDFRDLVKDLGMARQRGELVPNHFELKVVTKSGDVKWMDFTAATASYKGELAVLGTAYDVTERKKSLTRLEEIEEQRTLLVEKSPDAIVILTEGKIIYLNPSALEVLQSDSADMLVGKTLKDIVDPESLDRLATALNDVKKSAEAIELRGENLCGLAGKKTAVDITAGPVTYLGKRSVQLVARATASPEMTEQVFGVEAKALKVVPDSIVVTDKLGKIQWANLAFETLLGYSASELNGRDVFGLLVSAGKDTKSVDAIRRTTLDGNVWHDKITCLRKDGTTCSEDVMVTPVTGEDGSISQFVWVQQDSLVRKSFEEQLLRARKLEGIGRLVSSVVHDYNNILGVILGYGELLRKSLKNGGLERVSIDAILNATRRGTDLTRQLLDFGEEGVVTTRAVDVNKAIKSMEDMLLKTIGENIGLEIVPLNGLWVASVDPIHLYEILMNLATNARDAIVGGPGTLVIKTSNVVVDETFAGTHPGFNPGEYVMITFIDNGMGMTKKTQDRIFEPFFTTKDEELSPGLGLAAVHGMVKRNGGGITVRSTPGEGTTFCIYLPRFDSETIESSDQTISHEMLRSDKTVLVVEDQADLLRLVKHDLEEYGYKVLSAAGPEEALDICEEYPGDIALLLSDMILPGVNGKELSEKILDIRPKMRALYMSGYSSGSLKIEGIIDEGAPFIQKPFTAYELARKMSKVLGA